MKQTCLPALTIAIAMLALLSCSAPRYMYTAPSQNVPLLKEKGDSKAAAYYSSAPAISPKDLLLPDVRSYSRGVDVQGAYAFTDHFAGLINYSQRWEKNGTSKDVVYKDSSVLTYKRNMFEIGGGYYTALNQSNTTYFQTFAGVGFGKSVLKDEKITTGALKNHSVATMRWFVQPAFNWFVGDNFAFSVSSRFSFLKFSNIKTDYNVAETTAYKLDSLGNGYRAFWEPSMCYSFGTNSLPGVRFELQAGMSALLSKQYIDHRDVNISVGVTFNFAAMNGR